MSDHMMPAGVEDERSRFAADVLGGLSLRQKTLPSRYFYDARGSALFEEITRLPEYYPTRCEIVALTQYARALMRGDGAGHVLVELGSGSSVKTELLLEAAPRLAAYVPIDVSGTALEEAAGRLALRFPSLAIVPVCADFTQLATLPALVGSAPKIGFFPGSTIGNFDVGEARSLLRRLRDLLSPDGRLILGVDLVKDPATLVAAYDDSAGVTAAFNLNMLERINRTFGAAFDISAFRHVAIYNEALSRIEMHLESCRAQTVRLLGRSFAFQRGETIHTECSHKYTIAGFGDIARESGWSTNAVFTDPSGSFSIHDLSATGCARGSG